MPSEQAIAWMITLSVIIVGLIWCRRWFSDEEPYSGEHHFDIVTPFMVLLKFTFTCIILLVVWLIYFAIT